MKQRTLILMCLICGACAAPHPPLETMNTVDLNRYQGTWYEIARLPNWFQKGCARSRATYTLMESGTISVRNECDTPEGPKKISRGRASVVDGETGAKLEVIFDNWISRLFPFLTKGKYWILYLDTTYTRVIVGTPDRKYLWIMARTPDIDDAAYEDLVARSAALGFDTGRLIRTSGTP